MHFAGRVSRKCCTSASSFGEALAGSVGGGQRSRDSRSFSSRRHLDRSSACAIEPPTAARRAGHASSLSCGVNTLRVNTPVNHFV